MSEKKKKERITEFAPKLVADMKKTMKKFYPPK